MLIEDNEGDILLTKGAFEEIRVVNKIIAIKDGQEAINFFETLSSKEDTPILFC